MVVKVTEELDRDKTLDEAIYLALCGLDHCRTSLCVTGLVRLEMAHHKLGRVIDEIQRRIDEGEPCTQHSS